MLVWKFYGMFDIESNSPSKKTIFKAFVFVTQALFIYAGFFLQAGAVFDTNSIEEAAQILFISFAYVNAAFKAYVIVSNRQNVGKLWAEFDAGVFKASDQEENM